MNITEEATIVSVRYEPSDSIERQGKRKDVQRYLNDGYYIKEHRNGYWVLVKTAQLNVTIKYSSDKKTFNMKTDVCELYGKSRISKSLIEKFKSDVKQNKVRIFIDSEGYYSLRQS